MNKANIMQIVTDNPELILRKKGRWGLYHWDIDRIKAKQLGLAIPSDYQSKDSFAGDTSQEVYNKLLEKLGSDSGD
jgi:hypothetical protein